MTTVVNVLRFDLAIVRGYVKHLAVFLVIMVMFASINGSLMAVPICVFLGSILASYPFSIGERDRADLLLASMPLRRRSIVLGRYLFAMADFAVFLVAGLAVMFGTQAAKGQSPVDGAEVAAVILASLVLYGLIIAVQYPLYFLLGYARARVVGLLPAVVVGAIVGVVVAGNDVGELATVIAAVATPVGAASLIAATIALLAGSAAFTWHRYARKDL